MDQIGLDTIQKITLHWARALNDPVAEKRAAFLEKLTAQGFAAPRQTVAFIHIQSRLTLRRTFCRGVARRFAKARPIGRGRAATQRAEVAFELWRISVFRAFPRHLAAAGQAVSPRRAGCEEIFPEGSPFSLSRAIFFLDFLLCLLRQQHPREPNLPSRRDSKEKIRKITLPGTVTSESTVKSSVRRLSPRIASSKRCLR